MADSTITQDNRLLAVDTPLGKDILLLQSLTGTEQLSDPFRFELELLAEVDAGSPDKVDPKKLMGEAMTVSIQLAEGVRYIHGIVRRFSAGGVDARFVHYRAELVPWLSLLDLSSTCRIFQNLAVPDIVEKVFRDAGFSDFELRLSRSHTTRDITVQYRETDLAFVERLLEEEGIFYFFIHEEKKHTLILADKADGYETIPEPDPVPFGVMALATQEDLIEGWEIRHELIPGKWKLRDYHFELPKNNLEMEEPALTPVAATEGLTMYDYPGGYARKYMATSRAGSAVGNDGTSVVKLRMEEEESRSILIDGHSTVRAFSCGYIFSVSSTGVQVVSGEYVLTAVQHAAQQTPSYTDRSEQQASAYSNRFTCLKSDVAFLPARKTPKPVAAGTHTAKVVDDSKPGSKREDIWPDKYGRVLIRFPWQLDDESSTCWVRVAQPRAGKLGGHLWIPRVGDEVLVVFLDGDVDAPVVVGSLYNSDNMPIYELPANKTQNGIKTRSVKDGGTDEYNELRFEDKKGSEHILLHAQKDLMTEVENDETRTVDHDRTTTIKNNETTTIKEGKEVHTLEQGDQEVTLQTGNQTVKIDTGKCTLEVGKGDHLVQVKMGKQDIKVDMGDQTTKVGMGNITHQASLGNISVKADLGKITIEALQGIELKVGMNSIKIDMMGVTVKGMMTTVEGQVQTSIKGLMTQVDGSAMLMAKGAITMIG